MEILITGAIGDFITVESYIPEKELKKIRKVYLASPKSKFLIHLFKLLPYWKDMEVEVIWDDWTNLPYIEGKEQLTGLLKDKPKNWQKVTDYSIFTVFKDGLLSNFKQSSFIKNKVSEIKQILPDKFIVINPNSVFRSPNSRKDIEPIEWANIKNYLAQTDQYAVVLGIHEDSYQIPNDSRIINLMSKTSVEESIEIIKIANGYIGIDSFLSVLAAQLFTADKILIKSLSPHVMLSKKYYYHPQKEFDFITNNIIPYRHSNFIASKPAIFFNGDHALSFSNDIIFQINLDQLIPYEYDYFQKYVNYKNTDISKKLNKFRVSIAKKYAKGGKILDIGIGSGEFIDKIKNNIFGFDINPYGIKWLKEKEIYLNPYYDDLSEINVITAWDSLEHIVNPCSFLSKIKETQVIILTIPIYDNFNHINLSKHFRKNEHIYYWTNDSILWYMEQNGFEFLESSDKENKCGRQGVKTFVFKKTKENKIFAFGQNIFK